MCFGNADAVRFAPPLRDLCHRAARCAAPWLGFAPPTARAIAPAIGLGVRAMHASALKSLAGIGAAAVLVVATAPVLAGDGAGRAALPSPQAASPSPQDAAPRSTAAAPRIAAPAQPRFAKAKLRTTIVDGIDESGLSDYGRLARMAASGRLDAPLARLREEGSQWAGAKVTPPFTGPADGTTLPGGQSDIAVAVDASGNNVVAVFNDGQGLALSPVSASAFAYSSDGGATFVDGGSLPSPKLGTFGGRAYPQLWGNPDVRFVPGGAGCQFIAVSVMVTGIDGAGAAPDIVYGGTAQTLAIHRSVDCGHTWSGPYEVAAATNPTGVRVGGSARDLADRPSLDVDPDTGRVLASWTNFTSTTVIGGGAEIRTAISDNILAGTPPTWSTGAVVNGGSADFDTGASARFAGNGSGNAYIAWARKSNDPAAATPYGGEACGNTMFARSTDNGATWSTPVKLHTGGICVGGDFWPMDQIPGNDRVHSHPAIAVDTTAGPASGNVYVVYSANDGKDGGDIHFVRSANAGVSFSPPVRLNARPGIDRAQWFPATTVAPSGRVYVIWYDQQIGQTFEPFPPNAYLRSGDLTETMMVLSDDAGTTWSRPAPVSARPFHAAYGNDASQANLGERIGAVASGNALYAAWAGNPQSVRFDEGQPISASFALPAPWFRRTSDARAPLQLDPMIVFETSGNGNGYIDPGEDVGIRVQLFNYVTNPVVGATTLTGIRGTLSSSTPGVTFPNGVESLFEPIDAGDRKAARFALRLPGNLTVGTRVELAITVATADGGTTVLPFSIEVGTRRLDDVLFAENFGADGPLPAGWSSVHVAGMNAVPWVTAPGGPRCAFDGLYHANADDAVDASRIERALSPPIAIPSKAEPGLVALDFWLCYETENDPDFNERGYDGLVLHILDETPGRIARAVLPDAFADWQRLDQVHAASSIQYGDYPRHLARSAHPAYLQSMPAWSGSTQRIQKSVHMELPGMQGSTVRLGFDYTQDGNGTCLDAGHAGWDGGTCGVIVGHVVMRSIAFVPPLVDLEFASVTVTPGAVLPGGEVTYQFVVKALTLPETAAYGYFRAANVVFTDALPAGMTFVSLAAPAEWTCTTPSIGTNGAISCSRPGLDKEETGTFTIVAKALTGPSCANSASVSTESPEKSLANNVATAGPCAVVAIDLVASLAAPANATSGVRADYVLGVVNVGTGAAQSVSLVFPTPASTTLVSASQISGPAFACTAPTVGTVGTVTCTADALAGGLAAAFAVSVKVDGATSGGTVITSGVTVATATPEASLGNNAATGSTTINAALLDVAVAGGGAGTVTSAPAGLSCPGACSAPFPSGAIVHLNAAASAGSVFAGWSGACTGTGACVVTMDKAKAVTATFVPDANSRLLAVTPTGSATGRVDSVPSGIGCGVACEASFADGATVTLYASGDVDAVFMGWTGLCSGTGACTVTMSGPQAIGAEFALAVGKLEPTRFDGDAKDDLVWRDINSAQTEFGFMDGLHFTVLYALGHPLQWAVTHAGDFDGDGKSELIWRDTISDETFLWMIDLGGYSTLPEILPAAGWSVTHVADFDGDGRSDLLWRNDTTGEVALWLMNGSAYVKGTILLADPQWAVSHVADFNGDRKADLVWRNATTGEVALWLMDGTTYLSGAIVLALPQWQVTGTGDFDGDGKSDLVWRNATTGETALWLMNGIAYGSGAIVTASRSWAVTQIADLDGDGRSDLVWRNGTTGATAIWLVHGLARGATAVFDGAPDWLVRRTADLNGDGKADLVWRNRATGHTGAWLMDGTTPTAISVAVMPIPELFVQ